MALPPQHTATNNLSLHQVAVGQMQNGVGQLGLNLSSCATEQPLVGRIKEFCHSLPHGWWGPGVVTTMWEICLHMRR